MKTFLSYSQESIELLLRLSNHVSGAGSKAIGKLMTLVMLEPPATSMAVE
jgi:hypothetical protein